MAALPGPVSPLELLGAEVAQRRVRPDPVVEALYVLEDLERRSLAALEGARVRALGIDGAHERLRRRVVSRRGDRAHRGPYAGFPHGLARRERGVLAAVVGVVDATRGRLRAIAILSACC